MCDVNLDKRKASEDLRAQLGLLNLRQVIRSMRLRWFGLAVTAPDNNWNNRCRTLEVDGDAGRRKPRKAWQQAINRDKK